MATKKKKRKSTKRNVKNIPKKRKTTKKVSKKNTNTKPNTNKQSNNKQNTTPIKYQNNTRNQKTKIKRKLTIFLLSICKVLLIFSKKVKNYIINKYNSSKERKNYKKKIREIKLEKYRNIDDDAVLLRYRDYEGFAKITVFFINRIRVIKSDMKKFKKKFKYGTLKDKVLILLMLMLIAGFSCIIVFCVYIVTSAPEISNERLYKSSSSVFLDKNGNVYARRGSENREKITYDYLPEVLIDAIVSAEDSRFFQHNGIDIARFTKAVIGQLLGRSDAGGGSTLTMQVSKLAATNDKSTGFAGIKRKFQDIYLAVFVFEKNYTKEQILEFYANIPYLGSGTYGVEQASKTYFGKSVSELTLVEAATIAGLYQAPDSYDPYAHPKAAENRRNTILNLMCRHGYITEEERDTAKAIPLSSLLVGTSSSAFEHQDTLDTVIPEVIRRTGYDPNYNSMTVYTSFDLEAQSHVNDIIAGKNFKWKNDVAQAGIAVINVEDGSIKAVGASRDPGQLKLNYATSISRHPGSIAKPVLDYGPAIEYAGWGTGTTVIDDKYTYTGGGQIKNFDNDFKGPMTAKKALAGSRNIPALFTFQQTTNEQKLEFVNNLNWHPEDKNGYIVESASIGGFDGVSPVQAAAAYATFARGGTYIEPYSFYKIELSETGEVITTTPKKKQAMSESTAYIINMMLKYAVTSGSVGAGSVSGTDLCAKTGTSTVDAAAKKAAGIKGNVIGDSWEVAYSPDTVIALWYGYPDPLNQKFHLTSTEGGNARKEITKKLTSKLIAKNSRFTKPASVVSVEIELGTDPIKLASADTPADLRSVEYFKKGTEPHEVSDRFDKLANPSDIKYTWSANSVNLSWTQAPTPNQLNTEYLTNYFNESKAYKPWAEKYLQERIAFNNSYFGTFGYQVYMVTQDGTTDLGFTQSNNFTVNLSITAETKFIVKASYQKFKANQSSGVTVNVVPNTSTGTTPGTTYSIEYPLSCSTVDSYNNLGPAPSDKLRIISNGQNVTNKANIKVTGCYLSDGNAVNCNEMKNGEQYKVIFSVTYGGSTRNKTIDISKSC